MKKLILILLLIPCFALADNYDIHDQGSLIPDDYALFFGSDEDFKLSYDETTDNDLELSDGANEFLSVTDDGTTATFAITGDLNVSGDVTGTSLDLGGTTALSSRSLVVDTGGVFDINLGTAAGDDFTVDTDSFVVSGDTGYIGVGTASPLYKLHLVETTSRKDVALFSTNSSDTAVGFLYGMILNNTNSTDGNYSVFGNQDSGGDWNAWIDFINVDHTLNKGAVAFTTRNGGAYTRKMYIDEDGNVGIGTTSPGYELEVKGNIFQTYNGGANLHYFQQVGNYVGRAVTGDIWLNAVGGQKLHLGIGAAESLTVDGGNVGIGTTAPGNPLAVNRSADGVIVDFESADTVEGTVSIAGNTTSYNAFVGSHYTQLKDGQADFPVGAVVVSTGEIIPCSVSKDKYTKVNPLDAVNIVTKQDAGEIVDVEVEDKGNILSEETTYAYDPETDTETPTTTYTYGTKVVQKKQLKDGYYFHKNTRKFYTLKQGYVKKGGKFYLHEVVERLKPNKEYFVYVDATTTAGDKRVYGSWLGKMSNDAKGMSFGKDSDPVFLVAQVGLFKVRATDTNGNIENGDWLETSTRAMEAQKQTSDQKLNSTIAKSMIDVDWNTVALDPELGYKWRLIPCTY